jgi:hypothetical protein
VYDTVHVAAFVPLAVRLGQGLGVNVPDPVDENVTVPVGLVAPVVAVSVTVAVHEVATPTTTGEVHDTPVEVGFIAATFWVTVAAGILIVSGRVVPNASLTRTHVLSGEATLLLEQAPKPDG